MRLGKSDNHQSQHVITTEIPTERRAHRRFAASELHGLRTARVKYGQDVSVIDISSGGVLFETTGDLKPDSTIVLEFAAASRLPGAFARRALPRPRDLRQQSASRRSVRSGGRCRSRISSASGGYRRQWQGRVSLVMSPSSGWLHVIGKYRDGRTVRGYTNDFNPTRPYLHVSPAPFADETKFVSMIHLDALFFLSDPNTVGGERVRVDRQGDVRNARSTSRDDTAERQRNHRHDTDLQPRRRRLLRAATR